MTDIVERLRNPYRQFDADVTEAAAEIERLRSVLKGRCEVVKMGADRFEQMSDEIERLRNAQREYENGSSIQMGWDEAADTIERCYRAIADLQAEVRRKSEEIEALREKV